MTSHSSQSTNLRDLSIGLSLALALRSRTSGGVLQAHLDDVSNRPATAVATELREAFLSLREH
jgi:hypothetical protein